MLWLRRRRRDWLDGWEQVAAIAVAAWPALDDRDRARLGETIEWLVRTKHWEGARGFALDREVVVTVAANAAVLLLGLDRGVYRHVRAVVVHPGTFVQRTAQRTSMRGVLSTAPRHLLGQAHGNTGPVLVSWGAVQRDIRRRGSGTNVVVHEFAHKIDAADGLFDGTPEIADRADRAEWIAVCTGTYRRLRRRRDPHPVLGDYATTNPSEFFAVASEAFIERPLDLAVHEPDLYAVLCDYYGQDPAARLARRG